MSLTLPQLIMLNHAAGVNKQKSDARYEAKKKLDEKKVEQEEEDPIVWGGKRLSEMTTMELCAYYGDFQS